MKETAFTKRQGLLITINWQARSNEQVLLDLKGDGLLVRPKYKKNLSRTISILRITRLLWAQFNGQQ